MSLCLNKEEYVFYVFMSKKEYVYYIFMSKVKKNMSFMSLCLKKGHVHYVFMSKLKEACLLVLLLASLSSKRILNRWFTHLFFLILQSVNQYSSIYGRLSRGKLQVLT